MHRALTSRRAVECAPRLGGVTMRPFLRTALWSALFACAAASAPVASADFRERLAEDEVVYFVLPDRFDNGDPANDRGGLAGDRLTTGFDPAHKGFFHGGDLKSLTARPRFIPGVRAPPVLPRPPL